ncbi:MAG: acyltransferase family protein, partial [Butyrivibrio sp.]|nr:acyltransferase family protein [Butyrivibrio sp.]
TNKRITWVDIGKYICIMCVMMVHLESSTDFLEQFYLPFFLTMFFFLAGYVYRQPDSFKTHIVKKIKGLWVPWFIFSNLNILLSAVISLKGNRNITSELLWNMIQIRGRSDGLWFIAALFVTFIPFYFLIKLDNKKVAILISVLLVAVRETYIVWFPTDVLPWGGHSLPWHIEYIPYAMIWMVLGYYFKNEWEAVFDKYDTLGFKVTSGALYLVLIFASGAIEKNTGYTLHVLPYITSVVGIVFVISICKLLKTNKYVSYVGANTLIYFALHGKLYAVIEKVLNSKFTGFYHACLNNVLYSSVLCIAFALLLSVILIVPAYVINRWLPWMVGRTKKR